MISNRRLIAMIGGRAKVGDPMPFRPLAAQPQVVRALRRSIVAIGASGIAVAGLSTFGAGMIDASASASAAVSAGGTGGSGIEQPVVADRAPDTPVVIADLESLGATATALVTPSTTAPKPKATPAPRTTVPPQQMQTASVVAPTPPPAASAVEAVILEVFGPVDGRAAIGVARCESHLNPKAISRGGGNWGLFQINTAHRGRVAAMGYQWEDLLDARVNALVAKSIFDEQGWQPWGCRRAAK